MAEEKHHHHLFHHKKEGEDFQPAADGGIDAYGYSTETVVIATGNETEYERITKEEKYHKHKEHLGEMSAAAAGAFALEKHEAKKDPEHVHKHKIEEEASAAAAVGAGGFIFHEHHEKKQGHKDAKEASGEKKHHHFG